jgi:hypothetical protein
MRSCAGVLVPGGFGARGVEGKVLAAKYCREQGVPYLGVCLGMQVMVIEYVRGVLGRKEANSEEFMEKETALKGSAPSDVVDAADMNRAIVFMPEIDPETMGGTYSVLLFFLSFLFVMPLSLFLSLSRSISACLHSLTPHDTSLTILPPSINVILTPRITLQVPCGLAAGPLP